MTEKSNLYLTKRINELERRIETLEAESRAKSVNPNNDSDYYSINEVAKALGVSRLTISRRIKDGAIDGIKVGRYWKIPKRELKEIFEA